MNRLRLAAVWVGIQALFIVGWAARNQINEVSGAFIFVKVVPVDSSEMTRGPFLTLSYEFSRPADSTVAHWQSSSDAVWVVLRPEGGVYVPARVSSRRLFTKDLQAGQVMLLGRLRRSRFYFGVEQYPVPPGVERPAASDLTVRLHVDTTGVARIEQLFVHGSPWPPTVKPSGTPSPATTPR